MENLEDILEQVDDAGRFQVMLVISVLVPQVWVGWSMLEMIFSNHVPKWCCPFDNMTGATELYCDVNGDLQNFGKTCELNGTSCNDRVFAEGEDTVINEWDLVCERKWMAPLLTSIQMAGVMLGSLFSGQIANRLGSKMTLCIAIDSICVTNIVAGFSSSWEMFMTVRFIIGIAIGIYMTISQPFIIEFISMSRRSIPSMMPVFQLAALIMSFICWCIPDWRWQHWFCAIMNAPCILAHVFIPESLRWLAVKGKVKQGMKVVEQIARWNRRPMPQGCEAVLKAVGEQARREKEETKYTYMDIFKGWHFLKTSVLLQIVWFLLSMCSYGIGFGASSLKLGVYLNMLLLSLSSLPALFVQSFVIERVGRRRAAAIFFGIPSVLGVTSFVIKTVVSEDLYGRDLAVNILCIIAKGSLSAAWAAVTVLTTEIYPTVIRSCHSEYSVAHVSAFFNVWIPFLTSTFPICRHFSRWAWINHVRHRTLGFGAANTWCRMGAVLAPFALNFEDYPSIALIVVGGGTLVCTVAVMLVDETGGKAMPDTFKSHSPDRDVSVLVSPGKLSITEDKALSPLV